MSLNYSIEKYNENDHELKLDKNFGNDSANFMNIPYSNDLLFFNFSLVTKIGNDDKEYKKPMRMIIKQ